MGLDYQNLLRIIISLLWILSAAYFDRTLEDWFHFYIPCS